MNGGETRLFPSESVNHSGKKAGFLPPGKYRKLMVRYLTLFRVSSFEFRVSSFKFQVSFKIEAGSVR
ncbi:Uncharacterized protein dnm_061150 [Desulfonema magnum]|uniref:Uncharacterized protein n=1 Tax=Desulfonema magnum TaxID=45655 RepID=A0A975BRU5_9BACT|nr:Uncharacterized protein dnm_061150 [Desulfonema magnum]